MECSHLDNEGFCRHDKLKYLEKNSPNRKCLVKTSIFKKCSIKQNTIKIKTVDIITGIMATASVSIIVYMGDDIRYDFYLILFCTFVAAVSFLAGYYEGKQAATK